MSGQRGIHCRNRSLITLAIFATFLLVAASASAGSDTVRPFSSSTPNPCNSDSVSFQGQEHIVDNSNSANGRSHINFMDQIQGKGVGSPSGLQYSVGSTLRANGWFPPGPLVFRTRNKVVSNGPADNFFETSIFRFNQDGSIGKTDMESDCRG
jgi:hypothetical protein